MIEQSRVKELLMYCAETGEFYWAVDRTGLARSGTLAGRLDGGGYRQISVDGRRYKAHRLAWLYVHGESPPDEIDHINGCRDDNRIANLRPVNRTINMRNKRRYRNASSPHPGVQCRFGGYQVYVGSDYIGSVKELDAAIKMRLTEEALRGYHNNHGRV